MQPTIWPRMHQTSSTGAQKLGTAARLPLPASSQHCCPSARHHQLWQQWCMLSQAFEGLPGSCSWLQGETRGRVRRGGWAVSLAFCSHEPQEMHTLCHRASQLAAQCHSCSRARAEPVASEIRRMTPHAAPLMLKTRPAEHPQPPVQSGRRRGELVHSYVCTVVAQLLPCGSKPWHPGSSLSPCNRAGAGGALRAAVSPAKVRVVPVTCVPANSTSTFQLRCCPAGWICCLKVAGL